MEDREEYYTPDTYTVEDGKEYYTPDTDNNILRIIKVLITGPCGTVGPAPMLWLMLYVMSELA